MTTAEIAKRISVNPNVCFGKPCIRGTRIWVSLIVEKLASGASREDITAEYPELTHADILAAFVYHSEERT